MSDYDSKVIRKHLQVFGLVQGVGFRYTAVYAAEAVGATGWVQNNLDGSVTLEIQGTEEQIDKVFQIITKRRYIYIENMKSKSMPILEHEYGFKVK